MNEENKENSKARLLTIGVAVVLILIICGICVVIHALRNREASENKLQEDIIEYANQGQEVSVSAQEIEKEIVTERETVADEVAEEVTEEPAKDSAMVVQQQETTADESIIEEEAKETEENKEDEQKTTAKWQKDAAEDLSKVEIDLPRQMSEMKGYWEAGNMAAVEDLAYLPRYRAASEQLAGTKKYYYFGDTDGNSRPHGKGLAMYTDNQYYYGEWKDGVRCGGGMWIHFFVYDKNAKAKDSIFLQHSYTGTWSNDLPNGEGSEHYDFIDENLEENVGYNRNFIGNFKNGLYDGEIYITNYYKDGNVKEWTGTAVGGVWQTMGQKDQMGQYPVIVETKNSENYQWMKATENKNQGVKDLISAVK